MSLFLKCKDKPVSSESASEGHSGVVGIFHDVKHLLHHEKHSECIICKSFGFCKGSRLEN